MLGLAKPIYPTCDVEIQPGAKLTFEVLETDAFALKTRVGKPDCYGIGPDKPLFYGRLVSLQPCKSTTPALALLRDRPTMCGVLVIESVVVAQAKSLA